MPRSLARLAFPAALSQRTQLDTLQVVLMVGAAEAGALDLNLVVASFLAPTPWTRTPVRFVMDVCNPRSHVAPSAICITSRADKSDALG